MKNNTKGFVWLFAVGLLLAQYGIVRSIYPDLGHSWDALLAGLAIFGAAFMLSWGAELAQLEIPQSLALAFLALIAVAPEYAIDLYFAWTAGKDPTYISKATANMTGANRLLIGIGWSAVLLTFWLKTKNKSIKLEKSHSRELFALLAATLYSFIIPLKGTLSIVDTIVLCTIFIYYMISATVSRKVEPEFEGPVVMFASCSRGLRIFITFAFFVIAGFVIYSCTERFAEGLLATGREWGLNEFLVVQWLAPLASESPEFICAIIFALKANPGAGLGTLVSSKVNQWTLLIGTLPLAYMISYGHFVSMPLDERQREEI